MATPTNPSSVAAAIVQRVKAAAASAKSAADDGGVKDPTEKGTVTPPSDPPIDGLPPNKPLTTGVPADDQTLKPGGTGTAVPAAGSQNAADAAATSPTTPLDKIATLADIHGRVQNILAAAQGKSAAAPAAPAAAPAAVTPATPGSAAPKSAAQQDVTPGFNQETLAKLASLALATEEGQHFMGKLVERELGQQKAAAMIEEAVAAHHAFGKSASAQEQAAYDAWVEQQKQAAYIQQVQEQTALELDGLLKSASAEDRLAITHFAKMSAWADANLADPLLKAAFEAGMADAAADAEAIEGGEELPTGEEEPAPEEIAELIQAAVESGQLPPEVAMQLMDALAQPGSPDGGTGSEMDEEMTAAASLVE